MRRLWAGSLTLALTGWTGLASGQERKWQPAPAATLGAPVSLGAPTPIRQVVRGQNPDDGVRVSQWVAGLYEPDGGQAIAPIQLPPTSYTPVSASYDYSPRTNYQGPVSPQWPDAPPPSYPSQVAPQAPYYPPPPTPPPPASDPFSAPKSTKRKTTGRERTSKFGDWMKDWNPFHEGCFESDHCFDTFISPSSNPFLFEDPRSLTEVRTIFLYQTIPGSNPVFKGGNAEFFGLQARLAFTDRFSVVMNKLGGVAINPGDESLVPGGTGFSEIWLGPKYTFIRNLDSGTLVAAGATFQIPTSSDKVYQDTGTLSVVPYISAAQNFCRSSYGSFNAMDTFGFSIRTDSERSNYFFNSIHLDYDIGNLHRVYPLVELNWFYYSQSGSLRDFSTEGRDLANIGSTNVSGRNNFTIATGGRYKFSEHVQTGLVFEFPLNGTRDLLNFRLGADLIFRY